MTGMCGPVRYTAVKPKGIKTNISTNANPSEMTITVEPETAAGIYEMKLKLIQEYHDEDPEYNAEIS